MAMNQQEKEMTPEQRLLEHSKITKQRLYSENKKASKKSKFDYLTIGMAILMALVMVGGILITLIR